MDEKKRRQLDQLKDFSSLMQTTAELVDTPETSIEDRYVREEKKNKLVDMATELSYIFPKDTHDIWKQYASESEPVPAILQAAYDRLSDEEKSAAVGVLQQAADESARSSNIHKILFRAIERFDAKFAHLFGTAEYNEEQNQAAFYVEIRGVFTERDFVIDAPNSQMPSLEDALTLTKFISRHNDPAQRAELERLAGAYQLSAERLGATVQVDETAGIERKEKAVKLAGKEMPLDSLYLVRVQDGLGNAKVADNDLVLTRHNDSRNTFHFSINSLVESHAYGKFDGDTVIISPLSTAFQGGQVPSGLGTADTWINADSDRSIRLAGATLIVPADAVVPEGAQVIRYDRGATEEETRASRDKTVHALFEERNAVLHKVGFDGWKGSEVSKDEYRALLSELIGPDAAQTVFLGRHANSPDGMVEDALAMNIAIEKRVEEGEKLWADQTGAEYPIGERISELRKSALQELTTAITQSSSHSATKYYMQRVQQLMVRDPSLLTSLPLDTLVPSPLPLEVSAKPETLTAHNQSSAEKDLPSQKQESFEFVNAVEPEPKPLSNFANISELIEYLAAAGDDVKLMPAPRNTVLHLDTETNAFVMSALSEFEASTLSKEMGGDGIDTDHVGNRITFRSNDFERVAGALAKLKLEDKESNALRGIVREILNKRIPDISDTTMQRAREMRQARLIELANLAQKEATTTSIKPVVPVQSGNDIGNAEVLPGADTVKTLPAQVERTYVRIPDRKGDRFYLNNRLDTVAFVDKGATLETKSDNEKTALDMVSIADARGWESIKVSGTEAFRRQVWLEASARGMTVRGYKPNEMDKALLAKRTDHLERNSPNAIEQADVRDRPTASGQDKLAAVAKTFSQRGLADSATVSSLTGNHQTQLPGTTAVPAQPLKVMPENSLSGVLLEHGKAPFDFDNTNKPNYFVKYRDDQGKERLTWGLDLERAITESQAHPGDKISLENLGKKPVEVVANVKDEAGKVVGTKKITTHRNSWNVEVARDFLQMPAQDFAAKHPAHVNAAIISSVTSKVITEHPKFVALSVEDKERLRSGVETKIAEAIEGGKTLPPLSVVKRAPALEVIAEATRETSRSR